MPLVCSLRPELGLAWPPPRIPAAAGVERSASAALAKRMVLLMVGAPEVNPSALSKN
jgi:hypothetical protein